MKILIADDAIAIRQRLRHLVGDIPGVGSVAEAGSYVETVEAIRRNEPDAVLLDVFMPGGTGIDVLQAIADLPARPRVIMLTACDDTAIHEHCLAAGADYCFVKGSGLLDALRTIEAMVDERAAGPIVQGNRQ